MNLTTILQEYKDEIRRLRLERDLYRERAIDEVADHHQGATRETATFDVDLEMMRNLTGGKFQCR